MILCGGSLSSSEVRWRGWISVPGPGSTPTVPAVAGEPRSLTEASEAACLIRADRRQHRTGGSGQRRGHSSLGDLPCRRWSPPCRGRSRCGQDEPRQGPVGLGVVPPPPDPIHFRPVALGRHRGERVRRHEDQFRVPARGRSSPTSSSATRSTGRLRRLSPLCSSRWRSARSPLTGTPTSCPIRSW